MRVHVHQVYPVVALSLLAAGTVWLERVTAVDDPRPTAIAHMQPDLIAERTRLVSYGEDGRQRYELLADKVTHYPDRDTTALERPRLLYQTEGRKIHIASARGQVTQQGQRVDLAGNVRVTRDGSASNPPLEFASSTLTVWPEDERAETSDRVVLTQAPTVVRADGLEADNLFGNLVLLGNVRVHMPRSQRNTP